jgi:hypothetical protein
MVKLTVGKQIQTRAGATRVARARCLELVARLRSLVVCNDEGIANGIDQSANKVAKTLDGPTKA